MQSDFRELRSRGPEGWQSPEGPLAEVHDANVCGGAVPAYQTHRGFLPGFLQSGLSLFVLAHCAAACTFPSTPSVVTFLLFLDSQKPCSPQPDWKTHQAA